MTRIKSKNYAKLLPAVFILSLSAPSLSYAIPFGSQIDRLGNIGANVTDKIGSKLVSGIESSLGIDIHNTPYYLEEYGSKAKSELGDTLSRVKDDAREKANHFASRSIDRAQQLSDKIWAEQIEQDLRYLHQRAFEIADNVGDRANKEMKDNLLSRNIIEDAPKLVTEHKDEMGKAYNHVRDQTNVPEPGTYALLLVGLLGMALRFRKQ